jgi:hypothetical protein
MPVAVFALGDGDIGVEQTVQAMRALIDQGKKDSTVHERAAWILTTYHVPAFDFRGEFRAIFHWVRKNIRWTRDPTDKEALHSAAEILRLGIGDCDDFSILMCSLLGTIGHRTRLVTISNHPEDPMQFSHIYCEVQLDDQWIPMDAGRRRPAFGQGPRNYFRRRNWDNDTGEFEDVQLGGPAMRPRRGMGFNTPYWRAGQGGRVHQFRGRTGVMLGQDGFDWSQFETELPSLATAVTAGTANIIRAQNLPAVASAQYSAAYNAALLQQQVSPISSLSSISPMWLLIGGGLLLVLVMKSGEGRY